MRKDKRKIKIPIDIKLQCFVEKYWILFRTILLVIISYISGKFLLTIAVNLLK